MPSERIQKRIDQLLDFADAAAEEQDWNSVSEHARKVLAVDPTNEDAQSLITMFGGDGGDSTPEPESSSVGIPTSFANGRYQVKSLLGEGGKKKVYLAHDTTLDRDVAFGLIKAEGLDADSRQRITREAQAMARLGDHPNLMPIFDLGEENGQPYMVQPLMVGGDVEALISDGRLSLEDSLRISSEICRGLEFAHSKGIIHRDLKPGNVWLTDDRTVRIGDFGLALSLDRSRLTQEKVMVGTVSYMPPEQATGGEVTPRADLYSLGAMLYEMVTGRPPFMGDDDIAIIGQHINTPPVAPNWHNQSLPQTLDSLIMRMLSKDPEQRPESASEVLQALEAIDPAEAAESRDEEQGSLDSMSGGVFVGRHREMDQLKATFEETLGGRGNMATLVGEPGIGKTRTAQELATYASMRGGQVLWGRCYEGGGAPPYWPWVQAIRSYVTDHDVGTIRREMGSTASVISEIVPDVKERLPDLSPPSQMDDPESARFRLFDSISTFLKTASNSQPIVLMLEDLHWSDRPSLMLLEFVARELSNSRLMIVGNYRDMELNRRHPLSVTLGELTREHLFERVLLRGLQKHDVHRFIEIAAGIAPPDALVNTVHAQTEGNPLFVTETVRLLIQEGQIAAGSEAGGGTSSWEIRIPEGVREVIGRRLDRLSERCNEVLTIAAVMGRQFRFGVLMKLVEDASENMLLDVLDEALGARIIEELPSEVGLYQFTHASMQETLTAELSANRMVRFHARVAEALEDFYGDDVEDHAAELVEHFAEAEVVLGQEKAVRYLLVAGQAGLDTYAYIDAAQHFKRGLGFHQVRDEIAANLNLGLATALMHTVDRSEMQEASDALTQAFDILEEAGSSEDRLIAILARFPKMPVQGPTGMAALYRRALELVDEDSPECADLLLGLANWARFELYDEALATDSADRVLKLGESINDELMIFRAYAAKIPQGAGNISPTVKKGLESLIDRVDDPIIERRAIESLGVYQAERGDLDQAERWANRGVQTALATRNRWEITAAVGDLMEIQLLKGDLARAIELWTEQTGQSTEARVLFPALLAFALAGDQDNVRDFVKLAPASYPEDTPVQNIFGAQPSISLSVILGDDVIDDRMLKRSIEFEASEPEIGANALRSLRIWLGISCVIREDREGAAKYFCAIRAESDFVPAGLASGNWIGAHFPALLASYLGHDDDADSRYQIALAQAEAFASSALKAFVASDYTAFLTKRDGTGDSDKAAELRDEAIEISQQLGLKPLLQRLLAQREILGS